MGNVADFGIKEFGSYSGKIAEMADKYIQKPGDNRKKDYQSQYVFFNPETKGIAGNSFKERIKCDEYNHPKFANAVVFEGDYIYGTSARDDIGLDKFDFIQKGNSQFALDLNDNGKVDDGEVFEGKLDFDIYRRTKENSEPLKNYFENLKIFKPNWLKK